jgi:hypothetical protein
MRSILLGFFCLVSLSASAQWISFKKHERFPLLEQPRTFSAKKIVIHAKFDKPRLRNQTLPLSQYALEVRENAVMKIAQHNMRFRIYNVASYNFSELAGLYVLQNRFSEAKWYFLQSNLIARQQNDDKHTIANLMALASVKADIGDFVLAQDDLMEAKEIASAKGRLIDLIEIEKKLKTIQRNRITSTRTDLRYAEAVEL